MHRSRTNFTRVARGAAVVIGESSAAAVAVEKCVRVKQEPNAGSKRVASKIKAPRPSKKAIKTETKQEPIVDNTEQENAGDAASNSDSNAKSKIKPEIEQEEEMAKPKNWELVFAGIQAMQSNQVVDMEEKGWMVSCA